MPHPEPPVPQTAAMPGRKRRRVGVAVNLTCLYRHHTDVFAGVASHARHHGWDLIADEFPELSLTGRRPAQPFDGIIARATPALAAAARRRTIPLVNVWHCSPVAKTVPSVVFDYAAVGRLAGEHLRSRGLERFCFLGHADAQHTMSNHELQAGFFDAVGDPARCACLAVPDMDEADGLRRWKDFRGAVAAFLKSAKPPVGIVVVPHDGTVRYLIAALQDAGLRVPGDVAIVAAVGEPTICDISAPTITRIELDFSRVGALAAERLGSMMDGGPVAAADCLRVAPAGIIVGDSTRLFICDDPDVSKAMAFIEQNAAGRIGVGEVAKAIGLSRRTLDRRFHDAVGVPIAVMIRRLRIQKAKQLLAGTDLLVKQVAVRSGFATAKLLHDNLVREEGMTPLDYRRRRQGHVDPDTHLSHD